MRREDLPIALPCTADWDTMTAQGKKRFCADCKKFVHDLSRLSEAQATALLGSGANLCVRYVHDAKGQLVFDLDPTRAGIVHQLNRAKRIAQGAVAITAMATAAAACSSGPSSAPDPVTPDHYVTMGAPVWMPPTAPDAGPNGDPDASTGPQGAALPNEGNAR